MPKTLIFWKGVRKFKFFSTNNSEATILKTALFYKSLLKHDLIKQHAFYAPTRFNKYDRIKLLDSTKLDSFSKNFMGFSLEHQQLLNNLKRDYVYGKVSNLYEDVLKDVILNPTSSSQKLLKKSVHVHNYSIYDYTFMHIYRLTVKKQLFDDLEESVELKCFDEDVLKIYSNYGFETDLLLFAGFETLNTDTIPNSAKLLNEVLDINTSGGVVDTATDALTIYKSASESEDSDIESDSPVNTGYFFKNRINRKVAPVKIISTDDTPTVVENNAIIAITPVKKISNIATTDVIIKKPVRRKLRFTKKAMQEIYSKDVLSTITAHDDAIKTQSDSTDVVEGTVVIAQETAAGVEQVTVPAPRKRGRPKKNTC